MKQADFVAGLIERFSKPLDEVRSREARTSLSAAAQAIGNGTTGYHDPSDLYRVQHVVTRAMQGVPAAVRDTDTRRAAFEIGHAATLIAVGLAHDKAMDQVIAALDIATHAADQLAEVVPATSVEEPGHVLPMSMAIGVAFLLGTDATRLSNAFGIASSMTLATRRPDRTGAAMPLMVALCCANGTLAACLAHEGFTASPKGLEGARGWRASLGGGESAAITAGLALRPGTVLSPAARSGAATTATGRLRDLHPELAASFEREHAHV
ncbi:MmgE/PrpD family protein [Oceanicola sp. 22II-s10i]|uniref:MmgE/PrpD family protein n=1 Tax=Oceanicola sp. 22II-s10i TaxID=1317116 RepID=UPI001595339B|nr:MmgE/PrpD family protein [Oceanicola sp. 22II-s10i]